MDRVLETRIAAALVWLVAVVVFIVVAHPSDRVTTTLLGSVGLLGILSAAIWRRRKGRREEESGHDSTRGV